ncbi:uncharacterized protein SOCEGT47_073100 [Sorangium cellulosum]|uniref:Calcium-binding protein n=1 Tax=Sorangium cellulosum TaxID=56 RepID=A0A4P2QAQ1_SORCE|nr:calcium-binding protein [Sorangium cellulosum]AUX26740.1 uncharacterized protein SOCEGT47_073100 [Sorangium cellulosum]
MNEKRSFMIMALAGALGAASACTAQDVPLEDILPSGDVDPVTMRAAADDPEYVEMEGTPGDDALQGTAADDIMSGLAGNDVMHGLGGHDLLFGGGGDDEVFGDDGHDIVFGDSGDDVLQGGAGNDNLVGDAGNDVMMGGEGSDTYYFDQGQDVIINSDTADASIDTVILRYIADSPDDVVFQRDVSHLLISFPGRSDTLLIAGFFGGNGAAGHTIDRIKFGPLSTSPEMTADEVAYLVLYGGGTPVTGTYDADYLDGSAGQDLLYGMEGDDMLIGYEGDDGLYGDSGNDVLYGGSGKDELKGGAGNDRLYGGAGGDSYLFMPGDGNDIIYQPSEPDWSSNYDYIRIDGPPALVDGASLRLLNDTDIQVRLAPEYGLTITIRDFLDPFTGMIAQFNELDDIRWPDHTVCRPMLIRDALAEMPHGTTVDVRTACGTQHRW